MWQMLAGKMFEAASAPPPSLTSTSGVSGGNAFDTGDWNVSFGHGSPIAGGGSVAMLAGVAAVVVIGGLIAWKLLKK